MTKGARLETLRWKPAPVQATYLGYIGGLPLPELDYLIADCHVIPPEIADKYHPKPLYLDDLYQANDSRAPVLPPVSKEGEGLPTDKFIFCSFSNYYKLSEEMFDTWMEILCRVEHGVLWIVNDNATAKENILARAALRGVRPERLIFAGRVAPDHYRARMALADLFLDTTPYNAGTVATDALRVGLPLLTLQGEPFASRMAGALLTAVGLPELVTTDRHSYIEMAVAMATDPTRYKTLRARLDGGDAWMRTIGNTERFTRQFEAAMASVVKRPK
jgi:predicted O-linked N-acetylglucosamine transferase (SPINDLY family)